MQPGLHACLAQLLPTDHPNVLIIVTSLHHSTHYSDVHVSSLTSLADACDLA